ncbi:Rieske 2Fe-2S domain-containing protein [Phototrophicus methaneseepsis]|uniref:Rieske 2Fe-2S domain-containing protein n=2 Tax=Phototrophicus methaneseepsis TaxID=2710758 RepID=A0A7S8E9Y9_9CHLR|nr:Rieske 2Fe-2S domain-containing protein [Phototrophicus methaneseepsis]
MATASVSQRRVTSNVEITEVAISPPNRREFLYYIWSASMFMLLWEFVGIGLWFAYPRFRVGEFGGTFSFDPAEIPSAGAAPFSVPTGRFHVSHLADDSLVVLYQVCTHLGCIPKWVPSNQRFECPCHGSKYELNGKWIEGPAPRSLDRFFTTLVFTDRTTLSSNEAGDPIPLEGREVSEVQIDTSKRILRNGRI